jgi:hypothetical protein
MNTGPTIRRTWLDKYKDKSAIQEYRTDNQKDMADKKKDKAAM